MPEIEFIDVRKPTLQKRLRKLLVAEEQKFTLAHEPFCFRCAKIDLGDRIEQKIKEAKRKRNFSEESLSLGEINLSPYGDIGRFKKVSETEAKEPINQGGLTKMVLIGRNHHFVCKERSCGVTVFVPNEEYDLSTKASTETFTSKGKRKK